MPHRPTAPTEADAASPANPHAAPAPTALTGDAGAALPDSIAGMMPTDDALLAKRRAPWYLHITTQILIAMILGVLVGHFWPEIGIKLQILATGFIKMIKMIIAPLIFLTVVTGMAGMSDLKKVGKMGLKAFIYFEIMAVLALVIGMGSVTLLRPGDGIEPKPLSAEATAEIAKFTNMAEQRKEHSFVDFIYDAIPDNFLGAFTGENLLQVLFVAVLFGIAIAHLGSRADPLTKGLDALSGIFFNIVGMIMKVAPIGAFGAMAFAISRFGLEALIPLLKLVLVAALTMAIFVCTCLWAVAHHYRFNLWKLIGFIREELIIVLGTGSSETVLPRIMEKMEAAGVSRPVVGLVIPTGYAFNLDGSAVYLAISVMFIAQAYHVDLSFAQEVTIFTIMMLTSKGAAAVTGSGFIVLAATIQATGTLPVEGLGLLLGIDRIMSSARAMTNLIGNAVATAAIARMEGELDDRAGIITDIGDKRYSAKPKKLRA